MEKLILLATLFTSTLVFADGSKLRDIKWQEISKGDGAIVYMPIDYKHESGLVPIRFRIVLNHNIARVLTVLMDESRKLEWVPKAKEIQVLEKKSVNNFIVYYRYHAPWPFKDRDFVIETNGAFDITDLKINVDIKSSNHLKDPKYTDTVRGTTYDGYTIIQPIGFKHTVLEMAFLNDFGGLIPKFVVNIVQKQWPYRFIKQLRHQLNKNDIIVPNEFKKKIKSSGQ